MATDRGCRPGPVVVLAGLRVPKQSLGELWAHGGLEPPFPRHRHGGGFQRGGPRSGYSFPGYISAPAQILPQQPPPRRRCHVAPHHRPHHPGHDAGKDAGQQRGQGAWNRGPGGHRPTPRSTGSRPCSGQAQVAEGEGAAAAVAVLAATAVRMAYSVAQGQAQGPTA